MKIALVHDYLREYGGAERVLEVLIEMFPDAPVFVSYHDPEGYPFPINTTRLETSFVQELPSLWPRGIGIGKWQRLRRLFAGYYYLYALAFRRFDLSEFDIVISSSSGFADNVITSDRQVHICYCHTPPKFLWLEAVDKPHSLKGIIKNLLLKSRPRRADYRSAQKVDHFIANSEIVRNRIKRFYDRDAAVIYPPVDLLERTGFSMPEDESAGDYYLVVSRLDKPKHIDIIIKAFDILGFPLIIVGSGVENDRLRSIPGRNVRFAGFVGDDKVCEYYQGCKALVIAAEDEDFGLTAVEAQLFGKPVIAPRQGGFLETIIEGETGVFFDQIDVLSLFLAILKFERLIFDPKKIKENTRRFSKDNFVDSIREMILAFANKRSENECRQVGNTLSPDHAAGSPITRS